MPPSKIHGACAVVMKYITISYNNNVSTDDKTYASIITEGHR